MVAMRSNAKLILFVLIILSIVMGGYQGFLYTEELGLSQALYMVWGFVFLVLLVLWVDSDSKAFPSIYKPFEYGFLVFVFYIPYLPYYLIKTRGVVVGISYLLGFVLLFNIGFILQWLIYWAS